MRMDAFRVCHRKTNGIGLWGILICSLYIVTWDVSIKKYLYAPQNVNVN